VVAFFEERRGRLYGFRWRDPTDWKSCAPAAAPAATDQVLGSGTGSLATFSLQKRYGSVHAPWWRRITKPVVGSVGVAVDGVLRTAGTHFSVDHATGVVTFLPGNIPASGKVVTAGFHFDVPVRFDTDRLEIDLSQFAAGAIPSIPVIEIRV
jgi:uncharacterized protein (TIGR02217 family)